MQKASVSGVPFRYKYGRIYNVRGKAGRRADRPPPADRPTADTGDRLATDWRPVTGRPTGDTTDTADRLAARLAAVPVTNDTTSKGPATTIASGKDGPRTARPTGQRQGLAERDIII